MDGASCIDADENGDQGKGDATGGGDGDEAAMVSGGDDGRGWGSSRGHGTGEGPVSKRRAPVLSYRLGLADFILIS